MVADGSRVTFSELVKQQVEVFGSQTALASAIGATQQSVTNWLGGKTPNGKSLARFIRVTDLDPEAVIASLISDDDPPPAGPAQQRVAATANDDLRDLVAELSRRVAEIPAVEPEEWSEGLRRAAFGGDEANYIPEGPRTSTRPVTGGFDPDEDEPDSQENWGA